MQGWESQACFLLAVWAEVLRPRPLLSAGLCMCCWLLEGAPGTLPERHPQSLSVCGGEGPVLDLCFGHRALL